MSGVPVLVNVTTRVVDAERHSTPQRIIQILQTGILNSEVQFGVREHMLAPAPGALPDPGTANAYYLYPWIEVTAKAPESFDDGDELIWTATIEFEAQYNLEPDTPGWELDQITVFLQNNLMFQVWPFVRETVASLSRRSGAPIPFLLPLMRADSMVGDMPNPPEKPAAPSAPVKKRARSAAATEVRAKS